MRHTPPPATFAASIAPGRHATRPGCARASGAVRPEKSRTRRSDVATQVQTRSIRHKTPLAVGRGRAGLRSASTPAPKLFLGRTRQAHRDRCSVSRFRSLLTRPVAPARRYAPDARRQHLAAVHTPSTQLVDRESTWVASPTGIRLTRDAVGTTVVLTCPELRRIRQSRPHQRRALEQCVVSHAPTSAATAAPRAGSRARRSERRGSASAGQGPSRWMRSGAPASCTEAPRRAG